MPKVKKSKAKQSLHPQELWRRNLPKALLGSILVSGLLFSLFLFLSSFAVTYSAMTRHDSQSLFFAFLNIIFFAIWLAVSSFILKKLQWQAPLISLAATLIILIFAAYNVTSLGQTLITYPVGFFLSCCVLLAYYYWYRPSMILWIALPALLLIISAFQLNQRLLANQALHDKAAQALENIFPYPIYFINTIPAKKSMVTHFFWQPSLKNIRFVMKGNVAINEDYKEDTLTSPPNKCGITDCVDLGEFQSGKHLYTDKNNPYFVEYYVMFDKTLIRISSDKTAPLSKTEVINYLQQFKKMSPHQLLQTFDQNYFLADTYYFIPQHIFTPGSTGFSVVGETDFSGL
jgi:hypothetical protein